MCMNEDVSEPFARLETKIVAPNLNGAKITEKSLDPGANTQLRKVSQLSPNRNGKKHFPSFYTVKPFSIRKHQT